MKDKLLAEICKDQPCKHGEDYCVLKEVIMHDAKFDARMLAQIDCVNRFKFDEGQRLGEDPGWRGAWEAWVERGFAAKFAKVFAEMADLNVHTLYRRVVHGDA